ncbi:hypothetical protein D3C76_1376870 [compost metagenome]
MQRVVCESDTLGLCPWNLIADDVKAGRLAVLPVPRERFDVQTDYAIVSRKGQTLSPAAAMLKSILLEEDDKTGRQLLEHERSVGTDGAC